MRCGILIIGSLWWDEEDRRANWREKRLAVEQASTVRAPIFYGRKSGPKRGNSYTMIFDSDVDLGEARLVPAKAEISSVADLEAEILELWQVEDGNAKSGQFSKSWGAVGALFGEAAQDKFAPWWAEKFRAQEHSFSSISADGLLDIPWPVAMDNALAEFDVILATANQPAPERPTADCIAKAWLAQTGGHESYFFNNIRDGIRTTHDAGIWSIMEESKPDWLSFEAYADAVTSLRGGGADRPA